MTVPPAGAHGGDAARIAEWCGLPVSKILDLSASMNPLAPDVRAVVAANLDRLTRYPDPAAATETMAETLAVDPDLLVLTNGGAEAIALVADEQPVGNVVEPEFSLYRRHLQRVDEAAPRWRSNPSNPLGRLAAADERAGVWDEAFYPLAGGAWSRGDEGTWRLGSLTKVWACPGLRIGYVIAPDGDAARRIRQRQAQWSVNGLALAVVDALAASSDPVAWTARIAALRARLVDELRRRDLIVDDTDTCWVLVHRSGLRERLAHRGVVVRDCASFGLPGISRIAVPGLDDQQRLLGALDGVLG